MSNPSKPSAKPVIPGKIVIRQRGATPEEYHLTLNDPYLTLDELTEVGIQILALVKAARASVVSEDSVTVDPRKLGSGGGSCSVNIGRKERT